MRSAAINPAGGRLSPRRHITAKSAVWLSLLLTLVYLAAFCYVLYLPAPIGAADNGDYWRYTDMAGVSGTPAVQPDYPYFYEFYDLWNWQPFTADLLNPLRPQLSNAYPISAVRLYDTLAGGTADNPYRLQALSLACLPLLLFGVYQLFRFGLLSMGRWGVPFLLGGIFLTAGSTHLGYLHSFYGEAMMYVWLLTLLGCACAAVIARRGSVSGRLLCAATAVSAHMLVTAKGQSVVAYPVWLIAVLILSWYHFRAPKLRRPARRRLLNTVLLLCLAGVIAVSGVSCVKLYTWNADTVSAFNVYNSLLNGLLPIAEDPEETLIELGLDPAIAQDAGKTAFDNDLYIPTLTPQAQTEVFDKVSVMDILRYYLRHPAYLYRVLQLTAEHAAGYDTVLLLERYTAADGTTAYRQADKLAFWEALRPQITPKSLLYYAAFYLLLFALCLASLLRNRGKPRKQLSVMLLMALMLTGLTQFPLPVIGNGLADPAKQLYLFMLSYDLTLLAAAGWLYLALYARLGPHKVPRR